MPWKKEGLQHFNTCLRHFMQISDLLYRVAIIIILTSILRSKNIQVILHLPSSKALASPTISQSFKMDMYFLINEIVLHFCLKDIKMDHYTNKYINTAS